MTVDTSIMVSITEANRNFSKVAKLVEEKGAALILKNNTPCFLITDIRKTDENNEASDENVLAISQKLMAQNKEAYEVLASEKAYSETDTHDAQAARRADRWQR